MTKQRPGKGRNVRLSEDDARERLAKADVVRLATADERGKPHAVVVTFVLDGDTVYTAVDNKPKETRDLKRLRNIRANPQVALLADHYENEWKRLWWVRADATAEIIEDETRMARPLRLLRDRYPQYRDNPPEGPVIAMKVDRLTGWSYT